MYFELLIDFVSCPCVMESFKSCNLHANHGPTKVLFVNKTSIPFEKKTVPETQPHKKLEENVLAHQIYFLSYVDKLSKLT